jgi:dihydroxyacetone kinase-like protein
VERTELLSADATVERIVPAIVADLPYVRGDEIILVVNGYGATTRMELFIVNRKIRQMLREIGVLVYATELGEFCTSQEMKGVSVTFFRLDEELKALYDEPCDSAFYRKPA